MLFLTQENNSLLLKPPHNGHLSTATASKIYAIYKITSPQRPVNPLMTHRKQNITVISAEGHKNSSQLDLCRTSDTWAIASTAYCCVPNLFSTLHSLHFVLYPKINNDKSRMLWKGDKTARAFTVFILPFLLIVEFVNHLNLLILLSEIFHISILITRY